MNKKNGSKKILNERRNQWMKKDYWNKLRSNEWKFSKNEKKKLKEMKEIRKETMEINNVRMNEIWKKKKRKENEKYMI